MQRVAVFLSDEITTRRLRAAFGGECLVDLFEAGDPEIDRMVVMGEVLAAIVDLRRNDGEEFLSGEDATPQLSLPGIELMASLHKRYPALSIVAYLDFTPAQAREILWAAHAGARELILREYDDLDRIARRILGTGRLSSIADEVFAEISPVLPADVRDFVRECLAQGHRRGSVDHVVARLQRTRKTIGNRLRAHDLPPPHRIVGWSRVLVVCRWLEDPRRSVEKVARDLQFMSAGGLRSFVRRYIGCGIDEMRDRGGLSYVVGLFRHELEQPRRQDGTPVDWRGSE